MAWDPTFDAPVVCGHCKHSFICGVPATGTYKLDCPNCDHEVSFRFVAPAKSKVA
jgi:hypothetical protein